MSLLLVLLECWALLQKFTQPGRWYHHRFMTSNLWCTLRVHGNPPQVSLHGLSRPKPILGSSQDPRPFFQQFSVLQRKGRVRQDRFHHLSLCTPACLCIPPHGPLLKGQPSSRASFSASSITFSFSLPGLLPWLSWLAGVVPKIHPWSFPHEKISESTLGNLDLGEGVL